MSFAASTAGSAFGFRARFGFSTADAATFGAGVGAADSGAASTAAVIQNLPPSAARNTSDPTGNAPCSATDRPRKVPAPASCVNPPFRAAAFTFRDGRSIGSASGASPAKYVHELLGLAATVPFDDRLNLQASVDDLDRDLMVAFLREVGSDLADEAPWLSLVELGRQMHVVGGTSEAPFPLNVGLMFFAPEPWRWFPVTQVDVVWFPDGPGGDRFTEKVFRGPLHRLVREALDYIRRNYIDETVTKHKDRAEATRVENFPFEAVEEAVVNAVYQRLRRPRAGGGADHPRPAGRLVVRLPVHSNVPRSATEPARLRARADLMERLGPPHSTQISSR